MSQIENNPMIVSIVEHCWTFFKMSPSVNKTDCIAKVEFTLLNRHHKMVHKANKGETAMHTIFQLLKLNLKNV